MWVLFKLIYRFNTIQINIPAGLVIIYMRLFQNLHGKAKELLIVKTILQNKAGGITFPNFKTSYIAIEMKIIQYWQRDTEINRTGQSPDIDPHKYGQLVTDTDAKPIQLRKGSLFN